MNDLKANIDHSTWLHEFDRSAIYDSNARQLFKLDARLSASAWKQSE